MTKSSGRELDLGAQRGVGFDMLNGRNGLLFPKIFWELLNVLFQELILLAADHTTSVLGLQDRFSSWFSKGPQLPNRKIHQTSFASFFGYHPRVRIVSNRVIWPLTYPVQVNPLCLYGQQLSAAILPTL